MNEGLVNEGQAPKYTEHDMQLYRDQSSPFTHPDNDYILEKKLTFQIVRFRP